MAIRSVMGCVLMGLIVSAAGCYSVPEAKDPVSVSDGELTMVIASPLPDESFANGEAVPFEIEIYHNDPMTRTLHPGPGGHYHVKLAGMETISYESDIPSFSFALPKNLVPGAYAFEVEYHDSDGETGRFEVLVPFRVRTVSSATIR